MVDTLIEDVAEIKTRVSSLAIDDALSLDRVVNSPTPLSFNQGVKDNSVP